MKTINIVPLEMNPQGNAGQPQKPTDLAASIDLDIFNADDASLEGERFWEAFWRTQHVYGGVAPGQSLATIFKSLDPVIIDKLQAELQRFIDQPEQFDEGGKNDILGMIYFLLSIEKGDADYNPFEQEGYDASLAYFRQAVHNEQQRRTG